MSNSNFRCPTCGRTEESIPVWEGKANFKNGYAPDYIGCTSCREMVRIND